MSKVSRLSELRELVRAEKVRIANEVIAELRDGTFDCDDFSAIQAVEIARGYIKGKVSYNEECRNEVVYSWEGVWTTDDEARLQRLYADLRLISAALKKAEAALEAKIPF